MDQGQVDLVLDRKIFLKVIYWLIILALTKSFEQNILK